MFLAYNGLSARFTRTITGSPRLELQRIDIFNQAYSITGRLGPQAKRMVINNFANSGKSTKNVFDKLGHPANPHLNSYSDESINYCNPLPLFSK